MVERYRFLVTGATGLLGGGLARALLAHGGWVRGTHLSREPQFNHPNLEWRRFDLQNMEECRAAVANVQFVFHCAAVSSGAADIVSEPLMHVTPNIVINSRLLEAAYRAGIERFVFLSSATGYPLRGDQPLPEDEMFSDDPSDVYFPVGWMKRYTEKLCQMYAEKLKPGMSTLIIRPSNVYGPGDKFNWQRSHVTAALIRRVVERQRPITVWGSGNETRDLIYIDDFVEGTLAAFALDRRFLAINIASGRGYTVKEILRAALDVDGFTDAEIEFDPTRPRTVNKLLVDVRLAQRLLGFSAKTSLTEGMRKTIAWLRANPPS